MWIGKRTGNNDFKKCRRKRIWCPNLNLIFLEYLKYNLNVCNVKNVMFHPLDLKQALNLICIAEFSSAVRFQDHGQLPSHPAQSQLRSATSLYLLPPGCLLHSICFPYQKGEDLRECRGSAAPSLMFCCWKLGMYCFGSAEQDEKNTPASSGNFI